MARRWRRRRRSLGEQTVSHTTVHGDLVQKISIAGEERLDGAARRLAGSVYKQLSEQTGKRSIWRPGPLVLRVCSTERPVQALPEVVFDGTAPTGPGGHSPQLVGDSACIADLFRRLPRRQLVVLGQPGAGKTVLAMLLALDLLNECKSDDDPVPVFLSLSSWHPKVPLKTWMAVRIMEDHRCLADLSRPGHDIARELIDARRILPVLDDLDEVPIGSFNDVIKRIDLAFGRGTSFVLASRTTEFEAAVTASGTPLSRAAVIEVEPVGAEDAIGYLRSTVTDDTRWRPLFERLRDDPGGPLACALATPLMLFLVRIAYEQPGARLDDLLAYTDAEPIEEHLLDTFIPAAYADYLGLPYDDHRAKRWLGTLARGPRELRWWHFRSPAAGFATGLIYAMGGAWIYRLIWNTWAAVIGGLFVLIIVGIISSPPLGGRFEIVAAERKTADPHSHLRRYRALATVSAVLAGITVGVALGAWVGGNLGADPGTARRYAVTSAAIFGTATLLSTAWGKYVSSRLWFAARGLLPLRLMRFIEDAHNVRGVLRRQGAFYQFRHARHQDRLKARKSSLLKAHPYATVKPETPRFRAVAALLLVSLARPGAYLLAAVIPAVVISFLGGSVSITYKSGKAPEWHSEGGGLCSAAGGVCSAPDDYWAWRVPPGTSVTTGFSLKRRGLNLPHPRLGGGVRITKCDSAPVAISVTTNTSTAPETHTLDKETGLSDLPWRLPPDFDTMSVTFRRLDHTPCTAQIEWRSPSLRTDPLFRIKSHFD